MSRISYDLQLRIQDPCCIGHLFSAERIMDVLWLQKAMTGINPEGLP